MLTKNDIEKLITRMQEVFPTKGEHLELEKTVNEIADVVNAHSVKLDNLASKHDLETMLEKSSSLAMLKAEFELMKRHVREKLHVEI